MATTLAPTISSPTPIELPPIAATIVHHRVARTASIHGLRAATQEDLEQDLLLDLVERLPRYNPEKSALSTFITSCVKHRTAAWLRERFAAKRDPRREVGSLDARDDEDTTTRTEVGAFADPQADQENRLRDLRMDLASVTESLSPDLKDLCQQLTTWSVADIARRSGMPRSCIYDQIARIRSHFARAGLNAYLGVVPTE
jgi:RNA polymerase sigma-70 factor (ECF subfamily)